MRWKLVPVEPTEEMLSASAAIPCCFTPGREYDAAVYRAMLAAAPAAPEAPSDAVCRKIDARARNGKAWLVWWPTVKLDDDGNLTDEVTGGTWLISEYQGHWIEPDCINAIGEWFGDGEEYAAEPTHYMPLPAPPLRRDGQTGGK
jgi:hypothetical protein